jgi:DNA-directed RNA polymerase III subunit RPC6
VSAPNQTLTQKELVGAAKIKDPADLRDGINTLLRKKLFTVLKDSKGNVLYKAVRAVEAKIKGDMTADEGLVYSHIEGAGNEGIWTKTLKSRTNLHQTVLNHCLKILEQKQLVKTIKSVKYPTRKIYMLYDLTPSADVSGGPWYSEHELDTAFIQAISDACLRYITQRSFPKPSSSCSKPLFSTSDTSRYPTAAEITLSIKKSKITLDTELTEEDIQMLLDVLMYDGLIEAIPALGNIGDIKSESESGSEDERRKKKKRRKHQQSSDNDDESSSESDNSGRSASSEDEKHRSRTKKRKRSLGNDADGVNEEGSSRKRSRKSGKKASFDTDSDFDSSDTDSSTRKVKHKKSKDSKPKSSELLDFGGVVYRAVRSERVETGWSQAPCTRCPQFDFCHANGPINPTECKYYTDWLQQSFET